MSNLEKSPPANQNRLLAALPGKEYDQLTPHMQKVSFEQGQVLFEPNETIKYAYFPLEGVTSMVVMTQSGASVEIGLVGREGFVGFQPLLGIKIAPNRAIIQIPGHSLRIDSEKLKKVFDQGGKLQSILHRQIQAQIVQMSQGAACNRLHEVNERLARWLLMMHDRTDSDKLPLTHEFLSQMLGANRATVSLTAGIFQQAGLIRYSRGMVTILNREGLEEIACECYQIVKAEFDLEA
ncbi:MAG TPA: Crp/Fnr family transcriptional regulator [Blastocatellia bacterium]|jgi:CRP-like cAMP-binding protein|nr:Crp/Fnr family transcriptional regulator [Blastocatellia bacterium]